MLFKTRRYSKASGLAASWFGRSLSQLVSRERESGEVHA